MKIKKGDNVTIIKGNDRGKSGKIALVNPKENKVVVHGLNQVKKTIKPKKEGEQGQIISIPRSIAISNVMILCPSCGKSSRVGFSIVNDKKQRICKNCKGVL